jgi:predicted secreted Zn-dependent protease
LTAGAKKATSVALGMTMIATLSAVAGETRHKVETYAIEGNSVSELRASLNRRGPVDDDGRRSDGFTKWNVDWTFKYRSEVEGGPCTAYEVDAKLAVTTILPTWNPFDRPPPALAQRWQTFSSALRVHEDGHFQIAVEVAESVRKEMWANRAGRDCKTLDRTLRENARRGLEQMREKQRQYDVDTDSGRKQGTSVL